MTIERAAVIGLLLGTRVGAHPRESPRLGALGADRESSARSMVAGAPPPVFLLGVAGFYPESSSRHLGWLPAPAARPATQRHANVSPTRHAPDRLAHRRRTGGLHRRAAAPYPAARDLRRLVASRRHRPRSSQQPGDDILFVRLRPYRAVEGPKRTVDRWSYATSLRNSADRCAVDARAPAGPDLRGRRRRRVDLRLARDGRVRGREHSRGRLPGNRGGRAGNRSRLRHHQRHRRHPPSGGGSSHPAVGARCS